MAVLAFGDIMKYNLELIEKLAKNKPISSITVRYGKQIVNYIWENRKQINWNKVTKCRLDFTTPQCYIINGDACYRPGFNIK